MELQIHTKKKLFVAYPWDMYIQSMYEDIFSELFEEWDIRHGSKVTLKDKEASEVEEFMNSNKHLYDVFVSAIEKSNFFIADVTGTKPNVMLELGIALRLSTNVLIVTSEDFKELPFDISSFRVRKYKSKNDLKEIIKAELAIYKKIKSQNFTNCFEESYISFPSEGDLHHGEMLLLPITKNIKNLRFRIEYKFLNESNSHDWLGIHLRTHVPIISSELVYVRKNQKLESVSFPGQRTPVVGEPMINQKYQKEDGFKLLELIIEGNSLKAITPDSNLIDDNLKYENPGGIVLHAWAHNPPTAKDLLIRFRKIEILSLDTTTPI